MTHNWRVGIEGRRALVTGSGRGVGRAVALALAGAGADVVVNYLSDEASAASAVGEARALGVKAAAVRADVSDEADAGRLAREAEEAVGPIDILVNNAHGRIRRAAFDETTWEAHAAHMDGILKGAYLVTRLLLPGMCRRGWGRVVNVGNNMLAQPVPGYSAYSSAMGAFFGFTRNLAAEAGPFGVTVNMVSPGFVMTGDAPNTTEAVREAIRSATPLGRLAVPEDVAGAALFFASELGGFVTGADLSVDGGKVMG